jgi:hypothetical protein
MFTTSIVAGSVIFVAGGIRTRFPLLRDMQMYLLVVSVREMLFICFLYYIGN